jgi:hypothetical protein
VGGILEVEVQHGGFGVKGIGRPTPDWIGVDRSTSLIKRMEGLFW